MTGFDFVFALFSLLLGLAISEVLGGFSRVVKLHARARAGLGKDVRVGWLVPLLALWVLLQLLSGWMSAYSVRDTLPLTYVTLVVVTAVVGSYYVLATLVWPDDPSAWPDFDLYYDRHNRVVVIGTFVLQIGIAVLISPYRTVTATTRDLSQTSAGTIALCLGLAMLAANLMLIFVRRRWLNVVLLVAVSSLNIAAAIWVSATGLGVA